MVSNGLGTNKQDQMDMTAMPRLYQNEKYRVGQ